MKIAFIGYGQVGAPLADHLQQLGHCVMLAASDARSDSVKKALAKNAALTVTTPKNAVKTAEVVFLATPFQANENALKGVAEELKGKGLGGLHQPGGTRPHPRPQQCPVRY